MMWVVFVSKSSKPIDYSRNEEACAATSPDYRPTETRFGNSKGGQKISVLGTKKTNLGKEAPFSSLPFPPRLHLKKKGAEKKDG
jgi:hypothetical protein